MCDICKAFDLDWHAAVSRGDTKGGALKLLLWDAHKRNTCAESQFYNWQRSLSDIPQPLQPELEGAR